MQAIDLTGQFWLPGPHSVPEYGRLVFDPVEGITLTLAEPLVEQMPNGEQHEKEGGRRARILGMLDHGHYREPVTLIDARCASRKKYRPDSLLLGGHFEDDENTAFESVIVQLRDAAAWSNLEPITVEVDSAVDGVERRRMKCLLK